MSKEERYLKEILLTHEEILEISERMGKEITKEYSYLDQEPILLIGLLKGCHPFMSDLLKHIDLLLEVDYMDVSSFFGQIKSNGEVKIIKDLSTDVEGRTVLIIEDIVDSGRTIKKVIDLLKFRGAKSVEVASLVDKPSGRTVDLVPKFIGKELPDAFLLGYGLDYQEMYRDLRCIGVPKDELIRKEENE